MQQIWPFNRGVPIEGKAGDTIFFHVHTVHGSQHNCSASPRPVFINRFETSRNYWIRTIGVCCIYP